MLHVCFCFSDTPGGGYYRHPLVTMISIFEHTRAKVCVHLFADEHLTADRQAEFTGLCERYGQQVRFYPMQDIPAETLANVSPSFGKGSLYRLFIPDLIPEDLVLYLDCDVIVNLDIEELFAHELGEACLAGVHDAGQSTDRENVAYLRSLGISPERYIYSGMLLMNAKKLREEHAGLKQAVFAIIAQHTLRYPDQDAINRYFAEYADAVLTLPEKYNYVTGIADRAFLPFADYENKIVHYTSGKPWQVLCPVSLLYWKYYCSWYPAPEAFAAMEKLGRHKYMHLYNFLLRHVGVRRMVNRLFQVSEQGLWQTVLDRLFPSRRKRRKR